MTTRLFLGNCERNNISSCSLGSSNVRAASRVVIFDTLLIIMFANSSALVVIGTSDEDSCFMACSIQRIISALTLLLFCRASAVSLSFKSAGNRNLICAYSVFIYLVSRKSGQTSINHSGPFVDINKPVWYLDG